MANHKNHRAALRRVATAKTQEEASHAADELAAAELNLCQLLTNRAEANPHLLFGCEDIAHMTGLSLDAVYAARKAGAPFSFGKARPNWVTDFLKANGGSLSIKSTRRSA